MVRKKVEGDEGHQRVYQAVAEGEARNGGEGVYLEEISRRAGFSSEQTRLLLHDLVAVQGLVTQLQGTDSPDLGSRYLTKPGR